MEFESAQSSSTAKLPILKLGEYDMWVIRIKQYFQVQDYALWEVIENGNSWVSVPQTAQENGTSVTKILGKFDGKSDEGFFVGYSLSSKAFRVYNTRTRRVKENLHIRFLENKPMIEGNGCGGESYVPVTAGTISTESAGTQGELNAGTSEEISQDCNVMPIWKDASYFDSPTKDVDNGEPKRVVDAQKQVEDGPDNENPEQDKFEDDSNTKDVNAAGQHVNTASPEVNTVGLSVNTASAYDQDSP
ncbi:ribonuclease H-like domain-containing protein [Tanacetum coccineum]